MERKIEGGKEMPFVNVKLTPEGLTPKLKEELVKEFTQILVDKLGKNPASTFVIIEEVQAENWGVGGQTVANLRKQQK